jgi:hypothetical protein
MCQFVILGRLEANREDCKEYLTDPKEFWKKYNDKIDGEHNEATLLIARQAIGLLHLTKSKTRFNTDKAATYSS